MYKIYKTLPINLSTNIYLFKLVKWICMICTILLFTKESKHTHTHIHTQLSINESINKPVKYIQKTMLEMQGTNQNN